jgi:large subunit ribosomal protein L25
MEGSPAVVSGGVVFAPISELEIRCKPLDLPSELVVDVSKINIGDSISASDIALPTGVTFVRDEDKHQVFAKAEMPAEEVEEVKPAEVVEGEAGAEGAAGKEGEAGAGKTGEAGEKGEAGAGPRGATPSMKSAEEKGEK